MVTKMLKVITLLLCTIASLHLGEVDGAKKTWKYTNDILNPMNWKGGQPSPSNQGVIFPKTLGSVGSLYELEATELTLPIDGEIEIRHGGFIQIDSKTSSVGFKVKKLSPKRWLDPYNWNFSTNGATPDSERVPCSYDDVVFPADATVAVTLPEISSTVNSIHISGLGLTHEQWLSFLETDYGYDQFFMSDVGQTQTGIRQSNCEKSGCLCHMLEEAVDWICRDVAKTNAQCLNPIKPIGYCNEMCGGLVVTEYSSKFDLDSFKRKIPVADDVDTYASKVRSKNRTVVQVIFVDKGEYKERSSKAAQKFQSKITSDLKKFKLTSASLQVSGIALYKRSSVFSIIFGTFVAASFIFGCLYFTYVGPLENYNLRAPISELLGGNFSPRLFSKFENKEEGSLSVAPSMVNLESSFDNPMYGSTESTSSLDVVALPEIKSNVKEGEHENPLYDETTCEEEEELIEELVDVEDERERDTAP